MKDKLLYVAHPYYHDNPMVMTDRYEAVCEACYLMLASGYKPVSTVMMWHPLKSQFNLDQYESVIMETCFCLLVTCDVLVVLTLPGWKDSKGIEGEVEWARHLKIPVRYTSAKDLIMTLEVVDGSN